MLGRHDQPAGACSLRVALLQLALLQQVCRYSNSMVAGTGLFMPTMTSTMHLTIIKSEIADVMPILYGAVSLQP